MRSKNYAAITFGSYNIITLQKHVRITSGMFVKAIYIYASKRSRYE